MFEHDMQPVQVAHQLWASTKSAYQWRRCWRAGGAAALASRGAGGAVCRLSPAQLARLRAELDKGPAVHGWAEDQRWTLERVATLIGRLFHVRYTLRGTSYLLHRIGFTPQVPAHRAAERDEAAIATWREGAWSNMKNSLANLGSCSTPRQLAAIVKNRLKSIQYRPALIDGFLAQTGLTLEPEPP